MSDFVIRLKSTNPKEIARLTAVLRAPQIILKQIGAVLLAQAQKAFKDQKLGDQSWPARYPGQEPPYVNVAGIVADFAAGRTTPPARRFQNRPAGIDTGMTLRSLTASKAVSVDQLTVKVASNTIGAYAMQNGGAYSTLLITKQVKDRLSEWMRRGRMRAKRSRAKNTPIRREDAGAAKLGWLFSKKSLTTNVAPRPFLGITTEVEQKIIRITGGEFVKAADAGGPKL